MKKYLLLALLSLPASESFAQCTAEILQTGQVNTCQNQSLTLNATPGGTAYQWMENGTNIPGATAADYTVPTGTPAYYNYTVEITFNTCTDVSDITSVYVMQQPAVAASSNSPLCAGQALNLIATTIPGATYVWSGPNSFTSTLENPVIAATTLANTGTYQVVATLGQCASAPASVNVVVNPVPVPVANSNGPLCQGQTLNLTTNIPGASYAWTGPNAFSATVQNPTVPGVQPNYSGLYSLTVTQNGCTSNPVTTNVVVNPLPATPVLSANTPLCAGQTLNLSASNVGTGVSYSWSGPNAYTNNTTTTPSIPNVQPNYSGTYTLTLSSMGCVSQGSIVVQVNAYPIILGTFINPTYPNISNGSITISGLTSGQVYTVSYIKNGVPMAPVTTTATSGSVVISNLSEGTYNNIIAAITWCSSNALGPFVLVAQNPIPDNVWPGDVNYDLVADNDDVLDLGLAYGQTGNVRNGASLDWVAQPCTDWGTAQVNGMDLMHADCNGDGTVDATDVDAVTQNYGMTHLKGVHVPQAKSAAFPDLYFDLTGITFFAGTTVDVPIKLGTSAMPMNNILGLAADIKVTNLALNSAPTISNAISWMGNSGNTINFTKGITTTQTDWAYVRTDHNNVSGEGTIAILTMEIPSDAPAQDAMLYFENVKIINSAGDVLTDYNVVDGTATIIPVSIISAGAGPTEKAVIVPNPSDAKADLQITLSEASDVQVTITDMTGRMVWNKNHSISKGTQNIALPAELASGIYTVQVISNNEITLPAMKWVKK